MSKVNLVNLRTHETFSLYSEFHFQRTKFNGKKYVLEYNADTLLDMKISWFRIKEIRKRS